jgi:protein O-mannosyl-transferase
MSKSDVNGHSASMSKPTTGMAKILNSPWLMGLFLVLATIIVYLPARHAGFIWDDDFYVTNNPLLTTPDGLKRIWFSQDSPSQYFPMTYTIFRVEHALWGFNPEGYHWVNILLHAVNALLLWRLLKRLGVPGAWLAAAIFALHPIEVESVAWITELKNVLSLFFVLLTLLCWIEFVEERPKQPWRWYVLSLVFCAPALFSKTTACTLSAALVLILWLKEKRIDCRRLAQVAPFLVMGIGMGLLTVWWERFHQGTQGKLFSMGLLERILVASHAVWFYAGKLFWPTNLTFSYPRWKINPADPLAYGWLVAGIGLCVMIYFARRFFGRSVETGVLFFVATLSPLLGFIMLYTFRYTFVADHYQYVAGIGLIALTAAGITITLGHFGKGNLFLKPVLCGILLLTLGVLTWRQCGMYADLETLWRTTIARNPNSFLAYNNLGNEMVKHSRLDEAIVNFNKALENDPVDAEACDNIGSALLQKGQVEEAITYCQRALEINPDYIDAHYNLGTALMKANRMAEAAIQFQKVLAVNPTDMETYNNVGLTLCQVGDMDEAIALYKKALKLFPNDVEAYNNLGFALCQMGRMDEAVGYFKKSLEINPKDAAIYGNLGLALSQLGRTAEAIDDYKKALAINPDDAGTQFNFGNALFQQGQIGEAIVHYQKALTINPDDEAAYNNLGYAFYKTGHVNEAIAAAQRALQLANEQNNPALASTIQKQLKLYQASSTNVSIQPEHP